MRASGPREPLEAAERRQSGSPSCPGATLKDPHSMATSTTPRCPACPALRGPCTGREGVERVLGRRRTATLCRLSSLPTVAILAPPVISGPAVRVEMPRDQWGQCRMRSRGSIRAALESGKRACGQVSKGARSKAVCTFPRRRRGARRLAHRGVEPRRTPVGTGGGLPSVGLSERVQLQRA